MNYRIREGFSTNVGFRVAAGNVWNACIAANDGLSHLPRSLYQAIDLKTISAIVGALFCEALAGEVGAIVNPIEKGHPDIVPPEARNASEQTLRNYPYGLEVKCTVGNVATGSNLKAGQKRVSHLSSVTWQAHHREVVDLMGVVWDFAVGQSDFLFPGITGVFYCPNLCADDWGAISGTTGRNTKVSGMRVSGKTKMANGWVVLLDDPDYYRATERTLGPRSRR
jgi:hypothetical protein